MPVLLQGPPGPSVCAWAEGAGVDLLVVGVGAEGAPATDDVVGHLLAKAPCPVLVVRAGRGAEGDRVGSGAMPGAARH